MASTLTALIRLTCAHQFFAAFWSSGSLLAIAFMYTEQGKHAPHHTSTNENMSLQTGQQKTGCAIVD